MAVTIARLAVGLGLAVLIALGSACSEESPQQEGLSAPKEREAAPFDPSVAAEPEEEREEDLGEELDY